MESLRGSRAKVPLALLLQVLLAVSSVYGHFIVEKSSLKILSPISLRGRHDAAIGNFGVPKYGGLMMGSLVYSEKQSTGCEPFDGDKPFRSKSSHPNILLVDRGGRQLQL